MSEKTLQSIKFEDLPKLIGSDDYQLWRGAWEIAFDALGWLVKNERDEETCIIIPMLFIHQGDYIHKISIHEIP
jgi:hypothetical protein